ncbi:MAG: hypothetical protein ACREQA_12855 [Candidatus Binatia bacterium]
MNQNPTYDQTLRAIGQALEAQHINNFNLTTNGDSYLVRGQQAKISGLQAFLRKWQTGQSGQGLCRLNYTLQDIERLEREGRARRRSPQRLPDFYSLPSILRAIGAYLDMKGAHLLEVYKRDLIVMILYQTNQGHPEVEERTINSFYNLSLQMCRKRQKRDPS